jgi:NADPH-dependent F420 reductase
MHAKPCIAILGGTGELGSGLAKRWLAAGYPVIIGSRSAERAQDFAERLGHGVQGAGHVDAAESADIVVLAVPFGSHEATLSEVKDAVQGKIVIDTAVPLVPPKVSVAQLPTEGSAAQIAQALLGEKVRVVSAFHTIAAAKLHAGERADCDVLVFGNNREARDIVIGLAGQVASRGIDGGMLANSAAAEAMTSVLIAINRRYKADGAGIRITGLPEPVPEGSH